MLAGIVAVVAGMPVVLSLAGDMGRRIARHRIAIPRSLAGTAAIASILMLVRPGPVQATMPPSVLRFDLPAGDEDPIETDRPVDLVRPGTPYVVEAGDTLWAIACRSLGAGGRSAPTSAEVAAYWPRIYQANRDVIGNDPDLLFPGQRLALPIIQEA